MAVVLTLTSYDGFNSHLIH